jgi:hypothetical protein
MNVEQLGFSAAAGVYVFIAIKIGDSAEKKGRSESAWIFIALAFGLLIPAVIIATIAPAPNTAAITPIDQASRKCPYCAEVIQPDAIKCKHCMEMLNTDVDEATT